MYIEMVSLGNFKCSLMHIWHLKKSGGNDFILLMVKLSCISKENIFKHAFSYCAILKIESLITCQLVYNLWTPWLQQLGIRNAAYLNNCV